MTLLVGKDKLEVAAATKIIRYNEFDVVVTEDQPMEVHGDHGLGTIVTIYQIGPDTFKIVAPIYGVQVITDGQRITIKVSQLDELDRHWFK